MLNKRIRHDDVNRVLDFWHEQQDDTGRQLLDKAIFNKYLNVMCVEGDKIVGTIIFRVEGGYAEILQLAFASNEVLAKLLTIVDKDMADGVTILVAENDVKKQCGLRDVGGYKCVDSHTENNTVWLKFEKEFRYAQNIPAK